MHIIAWLALFVISLGFFLTVKAMPWPVACLGVFILVVSAIACMQMDKDAHRYRGIK